MTLIDSHCHLETKDFSKGGRDEREEVIARAQAAGVERLICVGSGSSLDEVRNALHLAEQHPFIWAAIGIHPHDVARLPEGALAEIEAQAQSHPRVVAVGETGLDYYYDHSPRAEQQALFRAFIGIARRTQKPLSLHIRDAHEDAFRILSEEGASEIGAVVHCFTGTPEEAKRYLGLGLYISFSGVVTFKSAGPIRQVAAAMPLDRLLVETDCPYLAPVPMRGRRNEPAYVVHTARLIAELRGISPAELAQAASANTERLFRLPPAAKG
jgi:TatD DNase family protein